VEMMPWWLERQQLVSHFAIPTRYQRSCKRTWLIRPPGQFCFRANNLPRGGAEGNRTPDLCSAIAALSHLSYGPARSGDAGSCDISDGAAGLQSTAALSPSCFGRGRSSRTWLARAQPATAGGTSIRARAIEGKARCRRARHVCSAAWRGICSAPYPSHETSTTGVKNVPCMEPEDAPTRHAQAYRL
jgi:hypothetical protein